MKFPHASYRLSNPMCLARGRWPSLLLAGLLAASASSTWAQAAGSGSGSSSTGAVAPVAQPSIGARNPGEKSRLSRIDRRFIEEAAASGQMEVQAAQLAVTRASDKAVKDYAASLAEQHASVNSELIQLAAGLGIELPASLPRGMRNELEKLSKRTGIDFDHEFVREVGLKEHEREIKRFEKAGKDVKEPQLKAWIDKTLPVLQAHLSAAQKLPQASSEAAASIKNQQRMGAGASPAGSGTGTGTGGSGTGGGGSSTAPYGR